MGKKGTKRKTRWRALPLGEDDAGSGNEEELLDEDQSTTSSVVGQATNFKVHPPVFRMGEKPYRAPRRFPYERFRNKEPLIKLESKTFDEEEYTKITTPRQDVLFKKGYFGRKRESSVEETVSTAGETEGEEPMLDQYIITNGFLDERGHYYVNGSSYEVYDPYSNTVTVVVGPPPYTNGVTQPVLAAVSCQPVPLTPVEWYPPGSDWPSQGSAWTPSYPHGDPMSNSTQNSDANPVFNGHDGQASSLYHQPAYVVPNYVYSETQSPSVNTDDSSFPNNPNPSTSEALGLKDGETGTELKKTRRKSGASHDEEKVDGEGGKREEKEGEGETEDTGEKVISDPAKCIGNNVDSSNGAASNQECREADAVAQNESEGGKELAKMEELETGLVENEGFSSSDVRLVEKQSHSTQTNSSEPEDTLQTSIQVHVKESHSTQTMPEESLNAQEDQKPEMKKDGKNGNISDVVFSSLLKNDQGTKSPGVSPTKNKEAWKTPQRHIQDDVGKRFYQRRTTKEEERKASHEQRPLENVEVGSMKTSYAKKLLNGLENSSNKEEKTVNDSSLVNGGKIPTSNGPSDYASAQTTDTNSIHQSNFHASNSPGKTNYNSKRLSNGNKFIPTESKKNNGRVANGNLKNGFEKQRYNKGNVRSVNKINEHMSNKEFRFKDKKAQVKVSEKKSNCVSEVEDAVTRNNYSGETITIESRSQSEKSSTVSELSSPTELSSGQNTPPEKLIVRKMEQKIASDLNKSFEEKLKQNLTKSEVNEGAGKEGEEKEEVMEEETEEQTRKAKHRDRKKKSKGKMEEQEVTKDKHKPSRSKRRKRGAEEKASRPGYDEFLEENVFFHLYGKSQDFLSKAWESMNKDKVEPVPDLSSILTAENDEILETLGIADKWNLPKLPLGSDLLLFPGFGRERPKLKFEDFFTSAALKELQNDVFTKTNITNLRSTKPEEFFATIVENPGKSNSKNEKRENSKVVKRGAKIAEVNESSESAIEISCGNNDLVKKGQGIPKTGIKMNKDGSKCKNISQTPESKPEKDDEIKEMAHEEAKLGIVDAVNSWLQEQGDPEKVLSVNALSESLKELNKDEAEEEDEDPDQKNGLSNPIHVLSAEDDTTCITGLGGDNACIRVANISKDDGYLGTETVAKKEETLTKLYRSSSWDAKLSEVQIKKHFRFLMEASSWDRRKLKDVRLRKHFKFITDSANYCHDLIGDVRNGYEFASEELCDPRQTVCKYYTLSPSIIDSLDKSNDMDCENEVFDALEYKFFGRDGGSGLDATGNLSITDSGVHSETESNEEATNAAISELQYPLPNKEVCCKMQ